MIIPTSGKIEKPKTHLLWEDKIFSNVKKIKKFYFVLDLKVYTGSVQLLLILIDSDKFDLKIAMRRLYKLPGE